MGLLAILLVVFTDILISVLDVQTSTESTSSVAQDSRFIYTRFIYDINNAQGVTLPTNLGDLSNSLQFTNGGVTYTYALGSGNLLLTDPNGSQQLNSYDTTVSDLEFTRIGNINGKHTFRINFTVSSKIPLHGNTETKTIQTTAGLR